MSPSLCQKSKSNQINLFFWSKDERSFRVHMKERFEPHCRFITLLLLMYRCSDDKDLLKSQVKWTVLFWVSGSDHAGVNRGCLHCWSHIFTCCKFKLKSTTCSQSSPHSDQLTCVYIYSPFFERPLNLLRCDICREPERSQWKCFSELSCFLTGSEPCCSVRCAGGYWRSCGCSCCQTSGFFWKYRSEGVKNELPKNRKKKSRCDLFRY